MTQNRSSAVMQQRSDPDDSLDDFPTPPWATRALIEHAIIGQGWGEHQIREMSVREPACNRGYMERPLGEYFRTVFASDVHDYGEGYCIGDFLGMERAPKTDFVITNPPFRLAAQFVGRGLEVATEGVAVLVRCAFTEGVERYQQLFSQRPPVTVAQFCERVPMVKGRCDQKASTATAYCWLIWDCTGKRTGTRFIWIPPCRKRLEKPGDYEVGKFDAAGEAA